MMIGKMVVKRSGYDPRRGRRVKDPNLPTRAKIPAAKSQHEEAFVMAWRAMGGTVVSEGEILPIQAHVLLREWKFDLLRGWRFDFANYGTARVAVEIEGGVVRRANGKLHAFGRHVTGQGFSDDCEKYFRAAALGWRVFRLTPQMIDTEHVRAIMEAMG